MCTFPGNPGSIIFPAPLQLDLDFCHRIFFVHFVGNYNNSFASTYSAKSYQNVGIGFLETIFLIIKNRNNCKLVQFLKSLDICWILMTLVTYQFSFNGGTSGFRTDRSLTNFLAVCSSCIEFATMGKIIYGWGDYKNRSVYVSYCILMYWNAYKLCEAFRQHRE